jgi:voltage-gated sodium channel
MFFIVFTVLNVLIGIVLNAMDQAREEVATKAVGAETGTGAGAGAGAGAGSGAGDDSAPAISPHEAELAALRLRLAEVEAGYKVSPDHLRRIREELDRLAT